MFPSDILKTAERLVGILRETGQKISTAESCTGGLIAGAITAVPGSSDVFDYGFVTYSNSAKSSTIGVDPDLIRQQGAVSADVARAMAEGALVHSHATVAVSVTGIAGPGGATETKPVGLVHFACARKGHDTAHERHVFPGDRAAVREAAAIRALELVRQCAGEYSASTSAPTPSRPET